MLKWKPANTVLQGGTQQIKSIIGKRVRLRVSISGCLIHDPIYHKHETIDLPRGTNGFITNPLGADLLVAFPSNLKLIPSSLKHLSMTNNFIVVVINPPTFKAQFEIESG